MTTEHERYMGLALEAAARAAFTSPNPRVGAVVVRDGAVLSQGTHHGPGRDHAEVSALRGVDATGADLYVTLEPCSHVGRRPPCAPAIADAGIARVVAAVEDPDPRVSGTGLDLLRRRGVEVIVGPGGDAARLQLGPYLHQRRTGQPLVTLKLALTLDGRLAAGDGSSRWITGSTARNRVHERRRETDALLVGSGTVLADDPSLTARPAEGPVRHPSVIVADARGRVPASSRLFTAAERDVFVATTDRSPHERQTEWKEAGAEVLVLPPGGRAGIAAGALVEALSDRPWLEIVIEGGAALAASFLRAGTVGRLELYHAPILTGSGPTIDDLGIASIADSLRFTTLAVERLEDDVLTILEPA